mgnify:CR=1 FL=1
MLFWAREARQRQLHQLAAVGARRHGLGRQLQHAGDALDVDDVERKRTLTDGLDPALAVLVAQAQERVGLLGALRDLADGESATVYQVLLRLSTRDAELLSGLRAAALAARVAC